MTTKIPSIYSISVGLPMDRNLREAGVSSSMGRAKVLTIYCASAWRSGLVTDFGMRSKEPPRLHRFNKIYLALRLDSAGPCYAVAQPYVPLPRLGYHVFG